MKTISWLMTGIAAAALAIGLYPSGASAQVQEPFHVAGSNLSGTVTQGVCSNGSDGCDFESISGSIRKAIGPNPSGGTLSVSVQLDLSSNSKGPIIGGCYPTQGTGTITSLNGANVMQLEIQGWVCDSASNTGCMQGPLSYWIAAGKGNFATASGTGTFNAQSPSCFSANDAQVTMQGVILK